MARVQEAPAAGQSARGQQNFPSSVAHCTKSETTDVNPLRTDEASSIDKWPSLDPAALQGLAGDVVQTIEPHSEADPVAILIQYLVAFGSVVGRGPYYQVEGDRHHTNIFTVMVGETSKSRKGTSWGRVRQLYEVVDSEWARAHVTSGLSSGEGLIWAVRDDKDGDEFKVADKRLLVQEGEFAGLLRGMARHGNVISPVIRDAWDKGNLRTLTKNSPAVATGAHISIIGHITKDELRRHLDNTEAANGFANRFIFACVRRSKVLPFGGNLPDEAIARLAKRTREAVAYARNLAEIPMGAEARPVWEGVYGPLSEGRPGLLGAVTARAEAQVMRLALLYALLDKAGEIGSEHLTAALALWNYCNESAAHIFGDASGDPVVDDIMAALRKAGKIGMTRTEISGLFGRHVPSARIGRALANLAKAGKVYPFSKRTSGRPVERWFVQKAKEDDLPWKSFAIAL